MLYPSHRAGHRLALAAAVGLSLYLAGCSRRGEGKGESSPPPRPPPASSPWGSPSPEPHPPVGSPGSGRDDAHGPTKGMDPTQMGSPNDPRMGKPPATSPIDSPIEQDAGVVPPLELPPRPAP